MIHYCTYFDRNFLTRAIALHRSLVRHSPPFSLWALTLDEDAHDALAALGLEGVRPIRLQELEAADPELLAVKGTRSIVEYYFTCSPVLPRYLLRSYPEIDLITYLDADLLFYSSPQPIFDELGAGSVLIVPHRFPENLRHLEIHGVYNVGLLSFRNDNNGLAVLDKWRTDCIDWCYDRVEDDRYADQKYLDRWPGLPGVVVLENPGAGLAPWNVMRYHMDFSYDPPTVDDRPLVFFHFQGVKELGPGLWDVSLDRYGATDARIRQGLYRGYVTALEQAGRLLRDSGTRGHHAASSLREAPGGWRHALGRIRRRQVVIHWARRS